jgi:hypothetical protein
MKTILPSKFARAPFLVGVSLLVCALIFYYFSVLRVDYSRTALLDLGPYPDATEYFAQARSLLKDGWPSIQIGYEKLPSRYPFGYPILMLPWLGILPEADSVLAPFRTNQTIGLLLLLGVFGFYCYLAKPLTGGFAVLLLATLPGVFTFSRSSTSEISGSAFIVMAFMFAYLGLEEERRWKIYFAAVLLGFSLSIRLQVLFFAPLLLAMALFPASRRRVRWFLHCAAVLIVFALAASPVLMLHMIEFHSPFRTGYGYWVPSNEASFSVRYVPQIAAHLWKELALSPNEYSAAHIFGTGTVFVPAFILLVGVGLFFIRINRFVVCAFLAGLSFFGALLFNRYADVRYYLPLIILLVAVAVAPVAWAAKNLAGQRCFAAMAILVLFAAACLGYPSRSGYNKRDIGRSQAWDAFHFPNRSRHSTHFIAQNRFARLLGHKPGIVLSDIDPVYLNALLPDLLVAAPIDGKHDFMWSRIWRYDRSQALALVQHGLQQSLPVYALFVSTKEMMAQQSRLPIISGYQWTILNDSGAKAVVLKLTPAASQERPSLLGHYCRI